MRRETLALLAVTAVLAGCAEELPAGAERSLRTAVAQAAELRVDHVQRLAPPERGGIARAWCVELTVTYADGYTRKPAAVVWERAGGAYAVGPLVFDTTCAEAGALPAP